MWHIEKEYLENDSAFARYLDKNDTENKFTLAEKIVEQLNNIKNDRQKAELKFEILENTFDLSPLLSARLVNRMKDIRQLALSYLMPTYSQEWYAQHNRLEHSVGTVKISYLFLISLLTNSAWFRYRYDKFDGLFLMITALLHDLGHYPFAHYLEDTNIFPNHDDITRALILGDIEKLNLHSRHGRSALSSKGWHSPSGKNIDDFAFLDDKYDKNWITNNVNPYPLRYCEPEDLYDLHEKIKEVLAINSFSGTIEDFAIWYKNLKKADEEGEAPSRLIFRIFAAILSGPIDADKLHYLVNDSLHCELSIASLLEGSAFTKLIDNLRIPIRYIKGSSLQRFRLGISEDYATISQLVLMLRSVMYGEVYWSTESRLVTSLLRNILIDAIILRRRMFGKNYDDVIKEEMGNLIRGDDKNAIQSIQKIINIGIGGGDKAYQEQIEILKGLISLFVDNSMEEIYDELCRIYPSDGIVYEYMTEQIKNITFHNTSTNADENLEICNKVLVGPNQKFIERVCMIIRNILNLSKDKLPTTSVIIDLPSQKTSKRSEFNRIASTDHQGFARPMGPLWEATEDYFRESIHIIRIFIQRKVIKLDHEDRIAVRNELIERFS